MIRFPGHFPEGPAFFGIPLRKLFYIFFSFSLACFFFLLLKDFPITIRAIFPLFIFLLGFLLAFLKVQNLDLDQYMVAWLFFFLRPQVYIWKKGEEEEVKVREEKKKVRRVIVISPPVVVMINAFFLLTMVFCLYLVLRGWRSFLPPWEG
ncbi:MAG: hypothetical protein QXH03_00215 [Candidatus Bathyarchaeia archaeon]